MNPRTKLLATAAALAGGVGAALPFALAAAAPPPAGNLLTNPGGEAPPAKSGVYYGDPSGWAVTVTDLSGQGPYDSCYGGSIDTQERQVLTKKQGQTIDAGARFFAFGDTGSATLTQEVAVVPADVAGQTLTIGGSFGGFSSEPDTATLGVRFLDAADLDLGGFATTPVLPADRNNDFAYVARKASGVVPAGTTKLRLALTGTNSDTGTYNNNYVENVYATFGSNEPAHQATGGDSNCTYEPAPPPPTTTPTTPTSTTPTPTTTPTTTTMPTPTPPTPKPKLDAIVKGLPSTKKCVSKRAFTIRLRNPTGTTIASATVKVNGKTVATRKGARVTAPVDLRGLPKGQYTVTIKATLTDGRVITGQRKYKTCAKRGH